MSTNLLEGNTAIVTGSARGIGRMVAIELARQRAKVVICDLLADNCWPIVEEIQASGGTACAVQCDVTQEDQVQNLIQQTVLAYDRLDILVNNAGWQFVASVEESRVEDWDRTMAINLRGPFLCSKAAIPIMRQQRYGVIINITSRAGRVPKAKAAAYGVSKFGLNGFTLNMAIEVAQYGIRVLALAPSHTRTPLAEEIMEKLEPQASLIDWPDGSDFARTLAWMASKEASQISGLIIETGGYRP